MWDFNLFAGLLFKCLYVVYNFTQVVSSLEIKVQSTIAVFTVILGCCRCPKLTAGGVVTAVATLALILNYYLFSISLTFYNKRVVTVSIIRCSLYN